MAFSLQIYFDFSGYSDMAIGLGQMLGFDFPENFEAPYGSRSITEFWRRWHISLGSWFREYVYIPLGGNRRGAARHIFNILLVWGLTGLWHGAAYNFILWGLYYGLLLLLEKYVLLKRKPLPGWIAHSYTILLVFLGWGLFLCNSLQEVGQVFANLFGLSGRGVFDQAGMRLLVSGGLFLLLGACFSHPFWVRKRKELAERESVVLLLISFFLFLLCTAFLVTQNYNPFLYFRF